MSTDLMRSGEAMRRLTGSVDLCLGVQSPPLAWRHWTEVLDGPQPSSRGGAWSPPHLNFSSPLEADLLRSGPPTRNRLLRRNWVAAKCGPAASAARQNVPPRTPRLAAIHGSEIPVVQAACVLHSRCTTCADESWMRPRFACTGTESPRKEAQPDRNAQGRYTEFLWSIQIIWNH